MMQKVRGSNLPVSENKEEITQDAVRLQVYLAHAGVASRRACETIIADKRVSVNGTIVTQPGTKVFLDDEVCLDGKPVKLEQKKRYVLLNKPAGYVCSMADEKGRITAASLLAPHFSERLYNVGRLDMFSTGLVLFTNDGDFAASIAHPSSEIEKEYIVETSMPIPEELPKRFMRGIRIENVFYRCLKAEQTGARRIKITLIEGKNREIRRVFEYYQIGIKKLERVRIGDIQIEDLKQGEFRELSSAEVKSLKALCENKNNVQKYRRNSNGSSY